MDECANAGVSSDGLLWSWNILLSLGLGLKEVVQISGSESEAAGFIMFDDNCLGSGGCAGPAKISAAAHATAWIVGASGL